MSKTTAGASYLHALLHAEPAGEVTPRAWTDKEKTLLAVAHTLRESDLHDRAIERVIRLANYKIEVKDSDALLLIQGRMTWTVRENTLAGVVLALNALGIGDSHIERILRRSIDKLRRG